MGVVQGPPPGGIPPGGTPPGGTPPGGTPPGGTPPGGTPPGGTPPGGGPPFGGITCRAAGDGARSAARAPTAADPNATNTSGTAWGEWVVFGFPFAVSTVV